MGTSARTVIKAPSPEVNVKRLTGGFGVSAEFQNTNSGRQPRPVVDEKQARLVRDLSADLPKPVGVFFGSGNVASLRTGLPNASVLADPSELKRRPGNPGARSAAFRRMQCRALAESELNSVIAEKRVAHGLDGCTGFSRSAAERGMVVFTRDTE
jgi:hypothetical protein